MAQRSKFRADQGTKKLWEPQEGHGVVRALLPLPKKDIAFAVSFLSNPKDWYVIAVRRM